MFDSQNNNRGGYNIGTNMYHIAGSILQVQWTNQHSCGNENTDCDVIIQYACSDWIRDGTTTTTIPQNRGTCANWNCNEDQKYGMHEDFYSYKHCRYRERNKGLFTSNQDVAEGAIRTRQDNAGTKYGYECNEERDYYPYWHPTIWKDVAVLTNNITRCEYYTVESQNVKERWYCKVDFDFLEPNNNNPPGNKYIPISREACQQFTYSGNKKGVWTKENAHDIPPPECIQPSNSRDNHLGNSDGGQTPNYNWTIPNDISEHCALRIRYNITSGEYDRDTTTAQHNNQNDNQGNGPDIWSRFGFNENVGVARGYELVNDPNLDVFGEEKFKLQVALDTSQFGRTFQDRSHAFAIRGRPADVPADATIRNLNVRGKRGNIVQVFPAVEYDFTPNTLVSGVDDYVHVQWTGSDNNPKNNDGQGTAGTDRSNIVRLINPKYDEKQLKIKGVYGQFGTSYPQNIKESFAGFDMESRRLLSVSGGMGADMEELNNAGPYFDLPPRKTTMTGKFQYMCTRNNNFSNRNHKGKLEVIPGSFGGSTIDRRGGKITTLGGSMNETSVWIPRGSFTSAKYVELNVMPTSVISEWKIQAPPSIDYVSKLVSLKPQEYFSDDKPLVITMEVNVDPKTLYNIVVYRLNGGTWMKLETESIENRQVTFKSNSGGRFVAVEKLNVGLVVGIIFGFIGGAVLLILIIFFFRRKSST